MPDYLVAPEGRIMVVNLSERGPRVSSIEVVLNWCQLFNKQ